MRIVYVCADPGVPVFRNKGSSVHVQEVISSFLRYDARVKLFACKIGGERPQDLENIEVHPLPNFSGNCEETVYSSNQIMKEMLEEAGPFDLVYERYSLWSFSAMDYAKSVNIPALLEVNSPLIEEQALYRQLPNHALAEHITEHAFRTTKILLAVSNGVATYLKRYPYTHDKVHVVSNGVNPDRFTENHKSSRSAFPGPFTVGFVGTLKPWHGLSILVDAFELLHDKVANVHLRIVGDGPELSKLVIKIKNKNLLHLTEFTGAVAKSEIPSLLSSMDVAVAPYPALEHFYFSPLKVFEYMAAGLPVVASNIGQLKELIQDGINGILVPAGDSIALAEALEKLCLDPKLCKRLGTSARQTVLHLHTWDAVVARILDLSGLTALSPKSRVNGGDKII